MVTKNKFVKEIENYSKRDYLRVNEKVFANLIFNNFKKKLTRLFKINFQ